MSPVVPASPSPVPALDEYVRRCAEALWHPWRPNEQARRWLVEERGLPEDVLRANRVGLDLGLGRGLRGSEVQRAAGRRRPSGLPRVGKAVVLPVLVPGGAAYVQLRLLDAGRDGPRYLNPSSGLAPNPRLARYRPAGPAGHDEVIVAEGVIDALSATAAGYRAVAVLGAGNTHPAVAAVLARLPHRLVVAFDPDDAGRAGAERLAQLLRARHRTSSVLALTRGDLNESLLTSPDWQAELPAPGRRLSGTL